jgi:hypothetical protein
MAAKKSQTAAKRGKYLFLYLTLACFLGIIAIFVFDGYMGVYDTVFITTGEYENEVDADTWFNRDTYWAGGVQWGEKIPFRYEVDNRWFSRYEDNVEVALWHSGEQVAELVDEEISLASFDKTELKWTVDTNDYVPPDVVSEQNYSFTVIIKRGELERSIIIYVEPTYPPKSVITEPPG